MHGVEGPERRLLGGTHHEVDHEPTLGGFPFRALEHPLGQIEAGHDMAHLRREEGHRTRPRADIQHARRRGREEAEERSPPGSRLHRVGERVTGRDVVGIGVVVPPLADLVANVHAVRTAPRRAAGGTPARRGPRPPPP